MKILIDGSTGMLGTSMCKELLEYNHEVIPTVNIRSHMDIRNIEEMGKVFQEVKPDIYFHLAAETDVDRCEVEPAHAFQVNALGTYNSAFLCKKFGIPLVYVSTIGIFSGNKKTPYVEDDEAIPANIYGSSKLDGETYVKKMLTDYYIIRAGWMMGGGQLKDKKFIGKIMKQVKDPNAVLRVVDDKFGSPTYTRDFSQMVSIMIENKIPYGTYHCTNQGFPSRYEVALKIKEVLDFSNEIVAIKSSEYPLPALRADSEISENRNLEKIDLNYMRYWDDALADYLREDWM